MGQQGAHYNIQQQQQQQLIAARSSLLYGQQPFSSPLAQQHQAFHTPLGMNISSSAIPPPPFHLLHSEPAHVGVGPTFPDFVRGNTSGSGESKQETSGEAGETLYLKAADD